VNVEQVPLSELHLDPANVRTHPDRNRSAIRASLARFGLQKPVVIDANNVVRAGNGTVEAARELGWESIACVRTPLAGSEATAYSIADNRSAELADWDDEALAATLNALRDEDFDLGAVGFTDEEVDRLCGGAAEDGDPVDDPQGEWQGMPEFENKDATGIKCVVHFENEADKRAFEELVGQKIPGDSRSIWYPAKARVSTEGLLVVDEP
jgi:hypothetical protein